MTSGRHLLYFKPTSPKIERMRAARKGQTIQVPGREKPQDTLIRLTASWPR